MFVDAIRSIINSITREYFPQTTNCLKYQILCEKLVHTIVFSPRLIDKADLNSFSQSHVKSKQKLMNLNIKKI